MNQEPLFHKYPIYAVIQNQTEAVKKELQSIPANTLANGFPRCAGELVHRSRSIKKAHELGVPFWRLTCPRPLRT
jgi:hypothetical protein